MIRVLLDGGIRYPTQLISAVDAKSLTKQEADVLVDTIAFPHGTHVGWFEATGDDLEVIMGAVAGLPYPRTSIGDGHLKVMRWYGDQAATAAWAWTTLMLLETPANAPDV
jgi:hypothetical protein